jgi:tRNA pseudouridine38-40 synthase
LQRYFIKLAYDGSAFFGWQTQPNEDTVQDRLTQVLKLTLNDEDIKLVGCGRTDTGVHASTYYAHVDLKEAIPDVQKVIYKVNNFLPISIAVEKFIPVKDDAHARFDATSRTYRYYIHSKKDPFLHAYSLLFLRELDFDKMNLAAQSLLKYEDFSAFAKTGSDNKTVICKLMEANWEKKEDQWVFTISADRFLRNMVRAIVGTLIDVGLGKIDLEEFEAIIQSGSRQNAGFSAPAKALFLTEVKYDYICD